jgi:hypothetical protein
MTDDADQPTKSPKGFDPKPRKRKARAKPTAAASAALKLATIDGIPLTEGRQKVLNRAISEAEPVGHRMTAKQEAFCRHVAEGKTLSAAYRLAYDCQGSKDETVWRHAHDLSRNAKVVARLIELQNTAKAVTPHDPGEVKAKIIRGLVSIAENPNLKPAERLKAYELLGRWGEVALFDDRSTVKVETSTPEQAIEALRAKLSKLG